MTAPFKLQSGTVTIPGLSFNAESSTGIFWPSTGVVAITTSGIEVARFKADGAVLINTTADDGLNKLQVVGGASVGTLSVGTTATIGTNATVGGALGVTGATTLSGSATANNFQSASATITGGSLNNVSVGASTPSTGSFTTLSASGNTTIGGFISVTGASAITGGLNGTPIGATTPSTGKFTTLVATGTSTLTGNVGIGTAPASSALQVAGSVTTLVSGAIDTSFAANVSGVIAVAVGANNSGSTNPLGAPTATAYLGSTGTGIPLVFTTASAERMRIDSSGNVGIGSASAGSKLDVFGNVRAGNSGSGFDVVVVQSTNAVDNRLEAIGNSSLGAVGTASDHGFFIQTNATERMRVDTSGNVGIGTATPNQKLHVTGGALIIGAANMGVNTSPGVFSFEAPVFREYIGDGTGFSRTFSKRTASVTTDLVTIQDSGNVGIGGVPSNRFTVFTGGGAEATRLVGTDSFLSFFNTANTTRAGFIAAGAAGLDVAAEAGAGNTVRIFTSSVERVRIDSTGNVGIGAPPTAKLTVLSQSSAAASATTWGLGYSNFGPNTNSATGAAFGIGYNNTLDQSELLSLAPGSTWKPMRFFASAFQFIAGGSTSFLNISSAGNVTMLGTLTSTGNIATLASGSLETNIAANINGLTNMVIGSNNSGSTSVYGAPTGTNYLGSSVAWDTVFTTAATVRMRITAAGVIQDAAGNELGYKGLPQNLQGSGYTLVATDKGKHVYMTTTAGVTVPAGVFSTGDVITILNGTASSFTITQGASTTLFQAGTANTGNRTLLVHGIATLVCISANNFFISGNIS